MSSSGCAAACSSEWACSRRRHRSSSHPCWCRAPGSHRRPAACLGGALLLGPAILGLSVIEPRRAGADRGLGSRHRVPLLAGLLRPRRRRRGVRRHRRLDLRHGLHDRGFRARVLVGVPAPARTAAHARGALPARRDRLHGRGGIRPRVWRPLRVLVHPVAHRDLRPPRRRVARAPRGRVCDRRSHLRRRLRVPPVPRRVRDRDLRHARLARGSRRLPCRSRDARPRTAPALRRLPRGHRGGHRRRRAGSPGRPRPPSARSSACTGGRTSPPAASPAASGPRRA